VSRYQKGKTNLDFTEARDSEWQWHHLGHMQVCTSLQTDNHANTPPLNCRHTDNTIYTHEHYITSTTTDLSISESTLPSVRYQFRCLVNRGTMGVNSLPKTVTRQRCGCDLNPGPSAPESSTLTTRLPNSIPILITTVPIATVNFRVTAACVSCSDCTNCNSHCSNLVAWQPSG